MSNFNLLDMTASGGEGAEWVAAEGFAVVVVARSLAGVDHRFPFVRPPAASFSSLWRGHRLSVALLLRPIGDVVLALRGTSESCTCYLKEYFNILESIFTL